jgi:uncharacterized protein (TIGR03000 family)
MSTEASIKMSVGAAASLAALLLFWPDRVAGEPILVGRIIIGGPSNDEIDPGWGNYPSGHGFVNGYGFYPDYDYVTAPQIVINRWKWRGPPPAALPPLAEPDIGVPATAALLRVRVPADAEVWISDEPTRQRGELRRFVTPPLEAGRNQGYTVRARWTEGGRPVERTEVVRVHPGDRLMVDFLSPPEDAPASLGVPRKLNGR